MRLKEAVADRMQQVCLALAGGGLEVERAELRLLGRAHALRGIEGEHVRFAGDEGGEGQAGVEPNRAGETGIAKRIGADRHHRIVGAVIGRAATVRMQPQIGDLAAAGVHLDAYVAHFAARDLPREAQPIGEAILHPVRAELGRQEKVERAAVAVDPADLDRFDPLAVQLVTQILAQALADVGPVRRQVHCVLIFHEIVLCFLRADVRCLTHILVTPGQLRRCLLVFTHRLGSGTASPFSGIRSSGGTLAHRLFKSPGCPAPGREPLCRSLVG